MCSISTISYGNLLIRCTLAFDSLSAWLSIWLWSIRPTAIPWHDECCWWSTRGYASGGVGLIHMHKKQPRHFDCGLQVIKVVKIIVWYENPTWKGGWKKNWFKALVWPLQKVLEMLQSKKKNEKKYKRRRLGSVVWAKSYQASKIIIPNSTGSKRRQECQTMPACLVSLSYPTPVLHLSSISSLWMETKDFLQQAVAHWDGWPACILKKTNGIHKSHQHLHLVILLMFFHLAQFSKS